MHKSKFLPRFLTLIGLDENLYFLFAEMSCKSVEFTSEVRTFHCWQNKFFWLELFGLIFKLKINSSTEPSIC